MCAQGMGSDTRCLLRATGGMGEAKVQHGYQVTAGLGQVVKGPCAWIRAATAESLADDIAGGERRPENVDQCAR